MHLCAVFRKNFERTPRRGLLLAAALLVSACASVATDSSPNMASARHATPHAPAVTDNRAAATGPIPHARIIATTAPLQCVPYARRVTDFTIRGDAWTWWQSAQGRYRRDSRPAVGSILVLKRTDRLRDGHIAVVSRLLNNREILVEHANWLNRGQIHKHTLVRDTSPNNDWSAVRVWYTPSRVLGKRTYPAHGFIHPTQSRTAQLREPPMQGPDIRLLQERLVASGITVIPDGVFGPSTRAALVAYQSRNGLGRDGIAGPSTRSSLGL